jgi:hypothetical protein
LPLLTTIADGPAFVIRQLLCDLAVADDPPAQPADTTWPAYANSMPEDPDNVIVVYEDTNDVHGRIMLTGAYGRHLGIQVMVRSNDIADCAARADAIFTALAEQVLNREVAVGANRYVVHAVSKMTGPFYVGKDAVMRTFQYSINAQAAIRQLSDA